LGQPIGYGDRVTLEIVGTSGGQAGRLKSEKHESADQLDNRKNGKSIDAKKL